MDRAHKNDSARVAIGAILPALRKLEAVYAQAAAAGNAELRGKTLFAIARFRELRAAMLRDLRGAM